MIARVATFNHLDPDALDPDAVERLREVIASTPGYVAGYHLRNPETGKAFSITIFENEDSLKAMGQALGARPAGQRVGIDPDDVEFCAQVIEI